MRPVRTKPKRASLRRGKEGSAAIEFALFMPLFVLLLTGVVEIGFAMFGSMQVYGAVEAGMLYAVKNGFNSTGISDAITNSSGITGITASPAPTQFCGCPALSGIVVATCGGTCTGNTAQSQYIRINATLTRTSILSNTFLLPSTLTAQSIVRQN
ncbi:MULTISPECIES: TadE/TadG family type IV pilus assembly protein [Rhodomicrobium]|uniref:TadE/TadG family type IV pilus assembly protein n=1 Tax=Rhodomicrobium TaxID=1068 RepID=UPI000B4B70F3|nr:MULTISPECIES: TadE/TadG family type IV pilus assembly protein [Rhodomicrobium]